VRNLSVNSVRYVARKVAVRGSADRTERDAGLVSKVTLLQAEAIQTKVKQLQASIATSYPPDAETPRWLTIIEQPLREKLGAVGLLPKRQTATVADFPRRYIDLHQAKPATKVLWNRSRGLLMRFFEERTMDSVTLTDVQDFREWALREGGLNRGLAENTGRQMCDIAFHFIASAQESGLANWTSPRFVGAGNGEYSIP